MNISSQCTLAILSPERAKLQVLDKNSNFCITQFLKNHDPILGLLELQFPSFSVWKMAVNFIGEATVRNCKIGWDSRNLS